MSALEEMQAARKARRRAAAAMAKCACGNVARYGETQRGRCIDLAEQDDARAIIRDLLEHAVADFAHRTRRGDEAVKRARAFLGEG